MESALYWDMTSCGLENIYQRQGKFYYIGLWGRKIFYPIRRQTKLLFVVVKFISDITASLPTLQYLLQQALCEN
jgi:hypothetical protein